MLGVWFDPFLLPHPSPSSCKAETRQSPTPVAVTKAAEIRPLVALVESWSPPIMARFYLWLAFILVGGFNPSEKYEFVNGKDYPIYIWWKIKFMFQTTNQYSWIMNHLLKSLPYTWPIFWSPSMGIWRFFWESPDGQSGWRCGVPNRHQRHQIDLSRLGDGSKVKYPWWTSLFGGCSWMFTRPYGKIDVDPRFVQPLESLRPSLHSAPSIHPGSWSSHAFTAALKVMMSAEIRFACRCPSEPAKLSNITELAGIYSERVNKWMLGILQRVGIWCYNYN